MNAPAGTLRAAPVAAAEPRAAGLRHTVGPWRPLLIVTALLLAVGTAVGPEQMMAVDVVNAVVLVAFTVAALVTRPRVELPFLGPVAVIAAASLIATTNAASPTASFMTMIQDAYLYVWFVVLVNLMREGGELRGVRLAWLWAATLAGLAGVAGVLASGVSFAGLFGPKGLRAAGTFGNANLFADYIVTSFFVVLSLAGRAPRLVRWGALAALLLALVASKSLGGTLALLSGMAAYAIARTATRRTSPLTLAAVVLVISGVAVLGWWGVEGLGIGKEGLTSVSSASMAGRLSKSAGSRLQIWSQMRERYERAPMGIGPGNSRFIQLSVANRERMESMYAKEAHNDYLGYAVERGPFALLALLALILAAFWRTWRGWRAIPDAAWRTGPGGVIAAALIGGLVATSFHSFMIEKLHFRHFWFFLALLCALSGPGARPLPAPSREVPGRRIRR